MPIILFQEKEEGNILMEEDIANYYIRYFSEIITYENNKKDVPQNIEIDINKIYSEIKKKIPNQYYLLSGETSTTIKIPNQEVY